MFPPQLAAPAAIPQINPAASPPKPALKLWLLILLENQTCPRLQNAPDPSTLKDIFKWYFRMATVIWSAFLHDIPKGKFTPGVYAFLEQQNANRAKVWFLSTRTNLFGWILARLSFASFSESIICSNMTDDTEEMKCGWGEGQQALESAPLPAFTLSNRVLVAEPRPPSLSFLIYNMGMMITTIVHRLLEV